MSGPYNFDYLVPEIRIPVYPDRTNPISGFEGANDWLDENLENLNCNMKNPYTGAPCLSDNSSIVSSVLIIECHKIEGLEGFPKGQIYGEYLDIKERQNLIKKDAQGRRELHIGPHYKPEAWTEPKTLITAALRGKEMFLNQNSQLLEPLRQDIDWAIGILDRSEFLPPPEERSALDRGDSVELTEEDEIDDDTLALLSASAFATIAIEAEKHLQNGAETLAFLSANEPIGFNRSPFTSAADNAEIKQNNEEQPSRENPKTAEPRRKGKSWFRRLFGG